MMSLSGAAFADAHSSYDDADFVIIGCPFDRTSSFRSGARFAPNRIREASYNFETYLFEHGVDLCELGIHDCGNLGEFATAQDMGDGLRPEMERIVNDGKFPILMGGEHSITVPAVKAFKDIAVVSIDAHLDSREEYLGDPLSHACVSRRISEYTGENNIVVVGVRSVSAEERDSPVRNVDAFTIKEHGVLSGCREALDSIDRERIYLTLDMDGIDPAYAPATGNPEPFGLSPYEVKKIIDMVGERLVGFDLVEVCPPYDNGNTAALAGRLIREIIAVASK